MTRRSARSGAAGWLWLAVLVGCATSAMLASGGLLHHRTHGFGVPDLTAVGWERVAIEETDVAFRRAGQGVIALRSVCGRRAPTARGSSRSLWYGLERDGARPVSRRIGSYDALEVVGSREGLVVRTLAVRVGDCTLDFVQVAPPGADPAALDGFVAGLRVEAGP